MSELQVTQSLEGELGLMWSTLIPHSASTQKRRSVHRQDQILLNFFSNCQSRHIEPASDNLMASAMAMSAAILSFSTTIASCYAFSSEPLRVLSQRPPRSISIPVLSKNRNNDDISDSINNYDDDTSKEVSMFERTFKVRPPCETFSTSTQPSNELPSSSQINANNDEVNYNVIEGKRRQRRRQGDDKRVSAVASSSSPSINLDDKTHQHGDADDLIDDVVEMDRTPVGANKNRSDVDSSRVALIGSIDAYDLTSTRETQIDDNNNNNNNDTDMAVVISSTTRKYANRATLLESVLAIKVQELQVMTNRARLMEDALHRVKDERQFMKTMTKATTAMMTTTTQKQHHGDDDALDPTAVDSIQQSAAKVNRVSTTIFDVLIDSSTKEELQTMANRVRLMENTLLQMKNSLQEKDDVLQHERKTNVVTVEALQNEIQSHNVTIVKLQSQLVELLDEVDDLEHSRDTEVDNAILSTLTKYKDMIHTMTKEYKVSLLTNDKKWQHQIKNETSYLLSFIQKAQHDKEKYRKQYKKEYRRCKKEGRKRQEAFQRALLAARIVNDSRSRLLTLMSGSNITVPTQEVDSSSVEYLPILSTVLATNSNSDNDTSKTSNDDKLFSPTIENEHGIIDIRSSPQREEMLLTDIEELEHDLFVANDRIHELEMQLRQRSNDQSKKSEQLQQLQEYLRAQLATYYDTIQEQSVQIKNHKQQITDMQYQYDEAMLIATRSVDAARRREETLLTNVEELENELNVAMAEWNGADELKQKNKEEKRVVMNMQERLVELEELLLHGSMREKTLIEYNEDLSKELIHQMANQVKTKLNTRQEEGEEVKDENDDEDIKSFMMMNHDMKVPQSQQLQRRRRWLRPWSLLWGR